MLIGIVWQEIIYFHEFKRLFIMIQLIKIGLCIVAFNCGFLVASYDPRAIILPVGHEATYLDYARLMVFDKINYIYAYKKHIKKYHQISKVLQACDDPSLDGLQQIEIRKEFQNLDNIIYHALLHHNQLIQLKELALLVDPVRRHKINKIIKHDACKKIARCYHDEEFNMYDVMDIFYDRDFNR